MAGRAAMLRIGLVMLQGARHVHMSALQRAADECSIEISLHELRMASDLVEADPHALVLPGGESTTMRLTGNHETSGLLPAVFDWIRNDPSRPVLGTCAGAILLSDPQDGGAPLIPASIDRNAYGSQSDSFQDEVYSEMLGREFPGVFIRAPRFDSIDDSAQVAATHEGEVVGIRHGNRLALTFHPELSTDTGFHRWLIEATAEVSG
ncbi:MAG TPA: pyridoxal 5'-phosphate synthase glutaminase subunit PdxT [Candidatus Poseidoniales archaeon]|nr:MAG TPA: pyridoxal 5'-phosphate synthase glutaminase subunit PdxT [Candidatus Poseidoniales archaeon]HIH56533.1 pyridoxal 5'-phosphate synthase glutaminase subunit PdxT [Candidatus Thalassarchaeum sp.]